MLASGWLAGWSLGAEEALEERCRGMDSWRLLDCAHLGFQAVPP